MFVSPPQLHHFDFDASGVETERIVEEIERLRDAFLARRHAPFEAHFAVDANAHWAF